MLEVHEPAVWQRSGGGHVIGSDPTHVPFSQVSVRVQGLPSLQGVPVVGWQAPLPHVKQPLHALPLGTKDPPVHVSGCWPAHVDVPGTQEPVHVPLVQTKGHGDPVATSVPLALHVSGCKPLHALVVGTQEPVHVPSLQTKGHAAPVATSVPFALHVSGC